MGRKDVSGETRPGYRDRPRRGPTPLVALALAMTPLGGCRATDDATSDAPSGAAASEPTTDTTPASGCGDGLTSTIEDPEQIPTGFKVSIAQQLDEIEGAYTGVLDWKTNDGSFSVAHAGTSSPLTMNVAYVGGEIRLTAFESAGSLPGGVEGGVLCVNVLEVDTSIAFSTADGLFAEQWTLPVRVYSEGGFGYPQQGTFVIDAPIDFGVHRGTLSATDFEFQGAAVTQVVLTAEFPLRGPTLGSLRVEATSAAEEATGEVAFYSATPQTR